MILLFVNTNYKKAYTSILVDIRKDNKYTDKLYW